MDFNLKSYKKYIDSITYSFYSKYKSYFIKGAIGLDDLKQEAYVGAWKIYEEHNQKVPEKELIKIMGKAVAGEMNRVIGRQIIYGFNLTTPYSCKKLSEANLPLSAKLHDNLVDKKELSRPKNKRQIYLLMSLVKNLCNEKEFKIFTEVIFKGKTFQEIADEQNLTKQAINLTYHKVINRLRKDKDTISRSIRSIF